MYTQHVQKTPHLGHGHSRLWVFLSLLALALVAGLLLSLIPPIVQSPAQVAAPQPVAAVDPAAPSVMNYIQVHERLLVRPVAPDAATQGVLNYLRAHGATIR